MDYYFYTQLGNFQPALLGNFQPVSTRGIDWRVNRKAGRGKWLTLTRTGRLIGGSLNYNTIIFSSRELRRIDERLSSFVHFRGMHSLSTDYYQNFIQSN